MKKYKLYLINTLFITLFILTHSSATFAQSKVDQFYDNLARIDTEGAKQLIRNGLSPNAKLEGHTLFTYALCMSEDESLYQLMRSKGGKINAKFDRGNGEYFYAIHQVAESGNLKVLKYMIEKGNINVNIESSEGETPLYYTFYNDNYDVKLTSYLISKGAKVNHKTNENNCPLSQAIVYQRYEGVKILIEKGADIQSEMDEHELIIADKRLTPLELASLVQSPSIFNLLLKKGANYEKHYPRGMKTIHIVAFCNFDYGVYALMNKGIKADDKFGIEGLEEEVGRQNLEYYLKIFMQ